MGISSVFLVQILVTTYMFGLAVFVMVVHYPMYKSQSKEWFEDYKQKHIYPTIPITFFPMLVEAGFSIWFWTIAPASIDTLPSLILLGLIWLQTFGIIVPRHMKLHQNNSPALIKQIIFHHQIRTVFWGARMVLLALTFHELFSTT